MNKAMNIPPNSRSVVLDKKSKKLQNKTITKGGKIEPCNDTGLIEHSFDFLDFFGKLLGWKCSYNWTWRNNPRHWFTVAYLAFTWSQFLYSQFKHFANGEYKRIIEVFALYGVAISVIEFLLMKCTKCKRKAIYNSSAH